MIKRKIFYSVIQTLIVRKNLAFDDFVKNEDGGFWGCICEKCVKRNNISEKLLDDVGMGTCSVAGCENEADYYIDFPEMAEPKESIWKIPLYLLQGKNESRKVQAMK